MQSIWKNFKVRKARNCR